MSTTSIRPVWERQRRPKPPTLAYSKDGSTRRWPTSRAGRYAADHGRRIVLKGPSGRWVAYRGNPASPGSIITITQTHRFAMMAAQVDAAMAAYPDGLATEEVCS